MRCFFSVPCSPLLIDGSGFGGLSNQAFAGREKEGREGIGNAQLACENLWVHGMRSD